MTPRTVIFNLPEDTTIGDVVGEHTDDVVGEGDEFRFYRIPVYDEDPDDITGYVLKDEMLLRVAREEFDVTLEEISRDILVVHETLPLPDLLERLLDSLEHIALVVDEYGGVAGVVTMEDVFETLLGLEIVDEADSVEDMQALTRKQWFQRARELSMVSEEGLETPTAAEADDLGESVLQQDVPKDESAVAAEMSDMARRASSESSADE